MQNSCEFFVYFLSFLQMEARVLGCSAQMLRGSADIKHKTEKYKSQGQAKTSETR